MGRKVALLVATYEYADPGLRRLTAPAHDAEALAGVLGDPDIAGFDVTTLVNRPHHEVGAAISALYRDRQPDDLALLYFTGHGLKDDGGRLYLAATDTLRDSLQFSSLSAELIDQAMTGCMSRRKVLILDCCYSGAFPAGLRAKADDQVHTLERFEGRGRTVLTASDATQYSFEADQLHGGAAQSVFTRHLVAGLRDGSADLDGDGDITLDELYTYVHDRVVDEMPRQRPKRLDNVEGRIVIARNVNWTLPEQLRHALGSPLPAERQAALGGLSHLHRVGNAHVRERALAEIRRLTADGDRTVSAAANALLLALVPVATREVGARTAPPPAPAPVEERESAPVPAPAAQPPAVAIGDGPVARPGPRRRRGVIAVTAAAVTAALAITLTVVLPGHGDGNKDGGSGPQASVRTFFDPPGLAAAALPGVAAVSMSYSSGPTGLGSIFDRQASGLVLNEEGYVLTTTDVLANGTDGTLTVRLAGHDYPAELVGQAWRYDVAVLKPKGLPKKSIVPLKLGTSRSMSAKDQVVAVRGGRNASASYAQGTVTSLHHLLVSPAGSGDSQSCMNVLATDASFDPADSGGPLLNADGKVVAVAATVPQGSGTTACDSTSTTSAPAFAIPIDQAARVATELITTGIPQYPTIGLVPERDASAHGALVAQIPDPRLPAGKAGLEKGDVVTSFDGVTIDSGSALQGELWLHAPGDKVSVTFTHDGRTHTTSLVLGSRTGDS